MKQFARLYTVTHLTFLFGKKLFFRGLKRIFLYISPINFRNNFYAFVCN
jgi:hypothetical protein